MSYKIERHNNLWRITEEDNDYFEPQFFNSKSSANVAMMKLIKKRYQFNPLAHEENVANENTKEDT